MIKKCEYEGCGKEFEGGIKAMYCPEHRLLLQREANKRYEAKNRDKKNKSSLAWYYKNREKCLARQKERNKANYVYKRGPIERESLADWKVEFVTENGLWYWKAEKKGKPLESAEGFPTLSQAKRDYLIAVS